MYKLIALALIATCCALYDVSLADRVKRQDSGTVAVNMMVDPETREADFNSEVTFQCLSDEEYENLSVSWNAPRMTENVIIEGRKLTVHMVTREDVGMYKCILFDFNDSGSVFEGEASSTLSIKAVKPGRPHPLAVTSFDESSITLSWTPGEDGYAPILYYVLEYKTEDSSWKGWEEEIPPDATTYTVHLVQEKSYSFRLSQANRAGRSDHSDPSSPVYLSKSGAVTQFPNILSVQAVSSTAVNVTWTMPATSEAVTHYYIEYRRQSVDAYHNQPFLVPFPVTRRDVSKDTVSTLTNLLKYTKYELRMFAKNNFGRGPPSNQLMTVTTNQDAPSAAPKGIVLDYDQRIETLAVTWDPPAEDQWNGVIINYKITLYKDNPDKSIVLDNVYNTYQTNSGDPTLQIANISPVSMPLWVVVTAATTAGLGPSSTAIKAALKEAAIVDPGKKDPTTENILEVIKSPWVMACAALILLIFIVMISIIVCRQKKIAARKERNAPLFNSFHGSVSSTHHSGSHHGSAHHGALPYKTHLASDGPQYERIPNDSRNTTPQDFRSESGRNFDNRSTPRSIGRSYDGRQYSGRSTPNSFIGHEPVNFHNFGASQCSMDSQRYSSQNSSIDDLASTVPSVTYSIPANCYKVTNPTSGDVRGGAAPPSAQPAPPRAKEHDPTAVKPKLYGNITVKEWAEKRRQAKQNPSETSLLSSFGKDSGKGSTDNVSVSASESDGSDIAKYLEEDEDYPSNNGYIEDDFMDVARMGMSRSPENSAFINPGDGPPARAPVPDHYNDNTSIDSGHYIQCDNIAPPLPPLNSCYSLGAEDGDF